MKNQISLAGNFVQDNTLSLFYSSNQKCHVCEIFVTTKGALSSRAPICVIPFLLHCKLLLASKAKFQQKDEIHFLQKL